MIPAANVSVRTGKRWRDITWLVRAIAWDGTRLAITLDADGLRRKQMHRSVQQATTGWRVVWAHWQAPALEAETRITEWRDGVCVVTCGEVREAA